MATEYEFIFTDTQWQFVSGDITAAMIEAAGKDIRYHLTDSMPITAGFDLEAGIPQEIMQMAVYGGNLWVKSTTGRGAVRVVHDSTTGFPYIAPDYVDDGYVQP